MQNKKLSNAKNNVKNTNEQQNILPPISLYIHIPWCIKKCPYCDFNSHQIVNSIPENRYIESLIADLKTASATIEGRKICSIFFGGGTPSLLSNQGLDYLMSQIYSMLSVPSNIEITMEANPSTVDQNRFQGFYDSGINRLSLGIQSFSNKHLTTLGRSHNASDAKSAIEHALRIYQNINIDMMYGLPNQTINECESDILTALSYKTQHLSYYNLTIEPNTFFAIQPPKLPEDDKIYLMQNMIEKLTKEADLVHYEVSAFSKINKQCQHNLNYWTFGDYLGIGSGAHSKISFLNQKKKLEIIREIRWKHPKKYMDSSLNDHPVETRQRVHAIDLPFEYMLNALRLNTGFFLEDFVKKTTLSHEIILPKIEEAIRKGLLIKRNSCDTFNMTQKYLSLKHTKIIPSDLGKRFLNDLQQIFLPNTI